MAAIDTKPCGYTRDIFHDDFDHKFLCGYCKLILRSPCQCYCGHRYCSECFQQMFRGMNHEESLPCPLCVEENVEDTEVLYKDKMFPDNAVRREMLIMDSKCPNNGCSWSGKFKAYPSHEQVCEYRAKACQQCGAVVARGRQEQHSESECTKRLTQCKFCNLQIILGEMEAHVEICPKYHVKCENCGKKKISRCQLQEHLQNECNKRTLTCPVGCPDQMTPDRFVQHLSKSTGNHLFWLMNKLELIEKRVMNGVTPLTPQCDLDQVMTSIDNLDRKVQEIQRQSQPSEDMRELSKKINVAETKVSTFEPLMGVLLKEIQRCLQVIDALERQYVVERQRADQMNTQMEQFERKMKVMERTIAMKDIQLAEQDTRMQALELATFDGTIVWKINDVSKKKHDAITGKTTSVYSSSFYTGKIGYRMCARIYLNGDGMGKATHISLFFVVMRGHYDALLPWPFQQKVTLMLLNQNGRDHTADTFKPDPNSTSFKRPTKEMNIASGCPLFLPIARTDDPGSGYVRDDVMFVKIIVDTDGLDKHLEHMTPKGSVVNVTGRSK